MSLAPVLPFDILDLIVDIVGENKETDLLKELALVSHSFLQICTKHLFATIDLRISIDSLASPKKDFIKLLESRPDVVKYIRKLTYRISSFNHADRYDNQALSAILLNFLPKFSRLNSLTITATTSKLIPVDWNILYSPLTSAFLNLMHLPTINHIDLSYIRNFPLSSLAPSVNLLRLDINHMGRRRSFEPEDGSPEIVVESMPKIREFNSLNDSALLTTKLLKAKKQDGRPAFNFTDLRRLSISFSHFKNEWNIRYLLQNAKLLEKLDLGVVNRLNLAGLLSTIPRTLKVLGLSVPLWDGFVILGGTCEGLEALSGDNLLEALSFKVHVRGIHVMDLMVSKIQKVEQVLVKPGWSALRRVSFELLIPPWIQEDTKMYESLQSLPDKYLRHLSKLESVAFNFQLTFSSAEFE
jgi:hypothetical protein